jgi:hypothetical protein
MRRRFTSLVVAAICLLALVSAIDAFRNKPEERETAAPEKARADLSAAVSRQSGRRLGPTAQPPLIKEREALERRLAAAEITGLLFLTDDSCRLWALALPGVDWLNGRSARAASCTFSLTPDGRAAFPGERVAFNARENLAARCRAGTVDVFEPGRDDGYELDGFCSPAWQPDGTLTLGSERGILSLPPSCYRTADAGACATVVVGRDEVGAAVTRLPGLRSFSIQEAAWLTDSRLVAVIEVGYEDGSVDDVVAVFENGRLISEPEVNDRFDDLRLSPRGGYFVVRARGFRGLWFFDAEGNVLTRNPIPSGHHVTWSPDERWTAVATGGRTTYLFRTAQVRRFGTASPPLLFRLPVYAGDLAWR